MNWELISHQNTYLQEYRLTENNICKVVLKYNPRHQSARLTYGIHQRLFFFESGASFAGKTIFRNEYGMEIGSTAPDKWDNSEGYIIIDTKKYFYQNARPSELIIFDNNPKQSLASCNITPGNVTIPGINNQNANSCLLLSLGWYLSLSIEKEAQMEYVPR